MIRAWPLLVLLALGPATAAAAPNPVNTTLTVPVSGDVPLADPRDVVHLAGTASVRSIVSLGSEELNIRVYIQFVDVRGVSSGSGTTCMASGGATRQLRLPATVQVPPQPTGPVSARVGVSCNDPAGGSRTTRVGQPVFTFSLTFDEDGTLVEASALMESAPRR